MEIKRLVTTVLLLGFAVVAGVATIAAAESAVGEIIYLEGQPGIVRGGRPIEDEITFGFGMHNLDHVRNDNMSLLQFALNPATGIEGSITVQPSSEFYLAFDESRQDSDAYLLRGSSSFSIERLPRGRSLRVHTAGAVMGVRGTEFSIDTSAQGEYLVSTVSGRVDVRGSNGDVIAALPGQAVEYTVTNGFRAVQLERGGEQSFRQTWMQQRLTVLQAQPDSAVQNFSGRYRNMRDEFFQRYDALIEQQEVIDRWIEEDRQGTQSSTAEQMRQKTAVAGPLMRIAAHMVLFERVYYRVAELRELLSDAEYSDDNLDPEAFFSEFDRDAAMLQQRLDMLRYIMRLYADRNNGRLPL